MRDVVLDVPDQGPDGVEGLQPGRSQATQVAYLTDVTDSTVARGRTHELLVWLGQPTGCLESKNWRAGAMADVPMCRVACGVGAEAARAALRGGQEA
jgi:hypothetical protein